MSLPFYFIFFVEKVRAVPCGLRYYVTYTFVFRWSSSRIFFSYLFFYFNILYIIFYSPLLLCWRASLGVSLPNKTLTKLFLTFSLLQFCRSLSRQRKEMASFEEAPPGDSKAGEKIFRTKCAQCHTVDKGAGHKQGKYVFDFSLPIIP